MKIFLCILIGIFFASYLDASGKEMYRGYIDDEWIDGFKTNSDNVFPVQYFVTCPREGEAPERYRFSEITTEKIQLGDCPVAPGGARETRSRFTGTPGPTLRDIRQSGELKCGVSTGLVGFAAPDANGEWGGFDVALCRAVAAAVLGDSKAVKFVPTTGKTRFTALASGEVDLLARNTTWTFSRDVDLGFEFVGVNYYDGQGFMVPKALGVTSATELDGATVCIQTGTTTELNLADFFRSNNMSYEPVPIETNAEAQQQYLAGACDVYTTDASGLATTRATFEDPSAHVVLPEIVSKEPLGPLVRDGDNQWGDIVRWTLNALITAEELGVNSTNLAELAKGTNNREINRLLGTEGDLGTMLGLDKAWAQRAIAAGGNYSEIFDRNLGAESRIGFRRGPNALWTDGGILYTPPFR